MARKHDDKKRIEIRFDYAKDGDVIRFLESKTDNMAGFIKSLVRSYVRSQTSSVDIDASKSSKIEFDSHKREERPESEIPKKKLPMQFHNNVIKGSDI